MKESVSDKFITFTHHRYSVEGSSIDINGHACMQYLQTRNQACVLITKVCAYTHAIPPTCACVYVYACCGLGFNGPCNIVHTYENK